MSSSNNQAEQQSNTEEETARETPTVQQEENLITDANMTEPVPELVTKESGLPDNKDPSLPPSLQDSGRTAIPDDQDPATGRESTSSMKGQDLSHQSLAEVPAAENKGPGEVIPVTTQEPHRTTSGINQVKHMSLHKEVLSPLAKGVQSVPIFALR